MIERTAGKVILVPTGLNEYLARARNKPRAEVINVPIPDAIADKLAVCVLTGAYRIIDNPKLSPEPGNARSDAGRVVFSAVGQSPPAGRLAVDREVNAKNQPILGNQVPDTPPPLLGQLGRVARRQYVGDLPLHQPCREQHAGVCRLGTAGRHEHREPRVVTALYSLERLDQQLVVRRRLEPAETAKFS